MCNDRSISHVKEELSKRFYKPIYLPVLALLTCLIIFVSKEDNKYNLYKTALFIMIIFVIIISEISLRYVSANLIGMLFFILFPIGLFIAIYVGLFQKFRERS